MQIILASNSPRRKQLLSKIIQNFDIIPSTIDEKTIKEQERNPVLLVNRLATAKANNVFGQIYEKNDKEFIIIGCDTIVYFNHIVMGKPMDRKDAIRILSTLQGKSNDVYTGTTIIIKKEKTIITETFCTKSTVYFKPMSNQDIISYVNTNEPMDKAGAYAIQGIGQKYLRGYEGSFDAIVGLDTQKVFEIFQKYHIK